MRTDTDDALSMAETVLSERLRRVRESRTLGGTPDPNRVRRLAIYGNDDFEGWESPGELFAESHEWRSFADRFKGGAPREGSYWSDPVRVPFRMGGRGVVSRALITSDDASAGALVPADFRGLLDEARVRPLTLRDVVTILPTNSDSIEWVRESRTRAAAPVAEAAALTGTSGAKPEGSLSYEKITDTVKTFAVWVPATTRILSDATGLRERVDEFLTQDLAEELEEQMLDGDGTGENFTGILNETGLLTEPAGSGPLYSLRGAITQVRLTGRARPNAVAMHPNDVEGLDLVVVNAEANHFLSEPFAASLQRTIWGLPIIETDAIDENTALVGDFRRAILFDRQETSIRVGTVNDDFIRNIVRVLGEFRGGFAVSRPTAFCTAVV